MEKTGFKLFMENGGDNGKKNNMRNRNIHKRVT